MRNECAGKGHSFGIRNVRTGKSYSFEITGLHIKKDCIVRGEWSDGLLESRVVGNHEKSRIDDLFEDDEVMKTHENHSDAIEMP